MFCTCPFACPPRTAHAAPTRIPMSRHMPPHSLLRTCSNRVRVLPSIWRSHRTTPAHATLFPRSLSRTCLGRMLVPRPFENITQISSFAIQATPRTYLKNIALGISPSRFRQGHIFTFAVLSEMSAVLLGCSPIQPEFHTLQWYSDFHDKIEGCTRYPPLDHL